MEINRLFVKFYCNLYKSTYKIAQNINIFLQEAGAILVLPYLSWIVHIYDQMKHFCFPALHSCSVIYTIVVLSYSIFNK